MFTTSEVALLIIHLENLCVEGKNFLVSALISETQK